MGYYVFCGTLWSFFVSWRNAKGGVMTERIIIGNKEAAVYLDCSARQIYDLRKEGKFPEPLRKSGHMCVWSGMQLDAIKLQLRPQGNPNFGPGFKKSGTQNSAITVDRKGQLPAKPWNYYKNHVCKSGIQSSAFIVYRGKIGIQSSAFMADRE